MRAAGFAQACHFAFGKEDGEALYEQVTKAFEMLPLASVVEDRILIVHGGIGDGKWTLKDLEAVQRPLDSRAVQGNLMVYNVMWSDPLIEDERKAATFGVHDSPRDGHRDMVHTFGLDVTASFCALNGLGMIIRSHQAAKEGDG
jgi:diadenosine tetraphosphatase ApaH/serine/threonine PP2A family protein phosphatase